MNIFKSRIKIIDWYIISKYLGTFLYTLTLFIVIIIIFDLSEKLDDFLSANLSFGRSYHCIMQVRYHST